jgi:hypothetical protein
MTKPSAAQDRIIRVPVGQPIPEGYRFKQLLGQETGLVFGAAANFTADVVLVEADVDGLADLSYDREKISGG